MIIWLFILHMLDTIAAIMLTNKVSEMFIGERANEEWHEDMDEWGEPFIDIFDVKNIDHPLVLPYLEMLLKEEDAANALILRETEEDGTEDPDWSDPIWDVELPL